MTWVRKFRIMLDCKTVIFDSDNKESNNKK